MPRSAFSPVDPNGPIDRPTCAECGTLMWLARIRPTNKPDHDERTFECPVCDSVIVKVVKFK